MKRILAVIAVIIWLFVIYSFSAQTAEDSSKISGSIIDAVAETLSIENTDMLHKGVRKLAHFTLYFVLALLVICATKRNHYGTAILVCAIYACTDEFHQLFITGRSGELIDIVIDTFGGTLGIAWDFITKKINKTS